MQHLVSTIAGPVAVLTLTQAGGRPMRPSGMGTVAHQVLCRYRSMFREAPSALQTIPGEITIGESTAPEGWPSGPRQRFAKP